MNKNGLQKEIDYLFLAKNNLWTIFLATSGGSLGLLLVKNSFLKWGLIISGCVLAIGFLDAYFKKDDKIVYIIEKLKENN